MDGLIKITRGDDKSSLKACGHRVELAAASSGMLLNHRRRVICRLQYKMLARRGARFSLARGIASGSGSGMVK